MRRQNYSKSKNGKIESFRFGELFSGPGGLAYGAINATVKPNGTLYKVKHEWSNDIHEDSCMTYRKNICPDSPESVICGPVEELKINNLSPIDAFAFGFPCNDYSIVGEKKGINGKYGSLYTYGTKILHTLKPKWFLAENVSGITSANNGHTFNKILHDLENAGEGYELTTHLYKFEEYGVPQSRHRIIIIGIKKNENLKFKVPAPTTRDNYFTAKEAIENPPISENAENNELTRQSKLVVERLKQIPAGRNVWNSNLEPHLQLNVKSARMSQIYRRLRPDKPSYTITGSGGGGTHGYHWKEPRALTNRERARLQTFPDKFIFDGSKESVRRQIGMAVPPKAAEIIVTAILKTFAGVKYKSVPANWV